MRYSILFQSYVAIVGNYWYKNAFLCLTSLI